MNGQSAGRIEHLDGLRGSAILLVVFYHAYVQWPDVLPFGNRFVEVPIFKFGFLGVQLFFLISGFVILMTLEKTGSFAAFMFRRWIRLFPAMLVASLLIYFTAGFFHERPFGEPVARDMLPGLTFIERSWWQRLLGSEQGVLEGAFWSLYVEVKFYVVFGAMFFGFGREIAIAVISALFFVSAPFVLMIETPFATPETMHLGWRIVHSLSTAHFGWFAAGAMTYVYLTYGKPLWILGAVLMGSASAMAGGGILTELDHLVALGILAFFLAVILFPPLREVAGNRLFVFLGFVSYPLYLIHENAVVSMIIKLHAVAPWIPAAVLPLLPILAVICVAWVIASFIEPELRSLIRSTAGRWPRRQASP